MTADEKDQPISKPPLSNVLSWETSRGRASKVVPGRGQDADDDAYDADMEGHSGRKASRKASGKQPAPASAKGKGKEEEKRNKEYPRKFPGNKHPLLRGKSFRK